MFYLLTIYKLAMAYFKVIEAQRQALIQVLSFFVVDDHDIHVVCGPSSEDPVDPNPVV